MFLELKGPSHEVLVAITNLIGSVLCWLLVSNTVRGSSLSERRSVKYHEFHFKTGCGTLIVCRACALIPIVGVIHPTIFFYYETAL